jgi:hypothetical protein
MCRQKKNNKQNPERIMMTEEQKNVNVIKWTNKGEKLRDFMSYYPKFLENGLTWNGVESIYNVYLKHHPIKMGIQSGPNTMDHGLKNLVLTATPN